MIVVVSAGNGTPSATRLLADRISQAIRNALRDDGREPRIETIEVRELAGELVQRLRTGFPGEKLQKALELLEDAEGIVAVTPVYTGSCSGLFKMLFDVLEEGALEGKPVLLAATAGTGRHSLVIEHAMRPLFAYLKAVPVPTGVVAAADDWGSDMQLGKRIEKAAGELLQYVEVLPKRKRTGPFEAVPELTELLNS